MKASNNLKKYLLLLGIGLFTLSFLASEEIPLSLSDCIRMAMQKNIALSLKRLNPEISKAKRLAAQGAFDLNFNLDHSYSEADNPTSSTAFTTTHADSHSTELTQKIPFGTTFGLSNTFANSTTNTKSFIDSYSTFWGASFTQPLLKNFGTKINLFDIQSAGIEIQIQEANYQNEIDQTVTDVANAFFELLFSRQDYESKKISLKFSEQLLSENKARLEIGTMTKLDLSQANSEVSTRQEELLRSEREIRTRENTLKLLISDQFEEWLSKEILPNPDSVFETTPPSLKKAFQNALTNRPDLQALRKSAEQKNLTVQYRKNQDWPELDLLGNYGLNGLDRSPGSSLRDTAELNKDEWLIGLSLKIPLQNRAAIGARQQSQLLQQQALIEIKQKEQSILAEVDNAIGQVLTNQKRVESTQTAREFIEETVEAEEEKFKQGSSTTFTLLRLQRDYSDAKSKEIRSKIDLEKALAELHRVQGLSLIYAQENKEKTPFANP